MTIRIGVVVIGVYGVPSFAATSDVVTAPLGLVADAFMIGRRVEVEAFE